MAGDYSWEENSVYGFLYTYGEWFCQTFTHMPSLDGTTQSRELFVLARKMFEMSSLKPHSALQHRILMFIINMLKIFLS